jgi:hypothetical protein
VIILVLDLFRAIKGIKDISHLVYTAILDSIEFIKTLQTSSISEETRRITLSKWKEVKVNFVKQFFDVLEIELPLKEVEQCALSLQKNNRFEDMLVLYDDFSLKFHINY